MYGWDSYFIIVDFSAMAGSILQGHGEQLLFEVEHYGAVLNANRNLLPYALSAPFPDLDDSGSL